MKTSEFDYHLPQEMIAQRPSEQRSESNLMLLDRRNEEIRHTKFSGISEHLKRGDVLVLNDSKVIPVRLMVHPVDRMDVLYEVFLLNRSRKHAFDSREVWEALICPGKKMKPGAEFCIPDKNVTVKILDHADFGGRFVEVSFPDSYRDIYEMLEDCGKVPLPPYITQDIADRSRYQTVYARFPGSVAAPTSGLHFTQKLLKELESIGVDICYITLHVGLGTFRPVKCEEVSEHKMEVESYLVDRNTAERIRTARRKGSRIVSCGTTSTRVLESLHEVLNGDQPIREDISGETNLYIYPGFQFKCIDALITNFHLPCSTLLMLVSAFYGREKTLKAYSYAVEKGFRFYSFGDAMVIF